MSRSIRLTVLAAIAGVATSSAAVAAASSYEPSVQVFDQAAKSKEISIHYVNIPTKGYVVVYGSDANGAPDRNARLGTADVAAGDTRDVKVTLKDVPKSGQRMWVGLYKDTDNKPGFDAAGDKPLWSASLPAENAFTIR